MIELDKEGGELFWGMGITLQSDTVLRKKHFW